MRSTLASLLLIIGVPICLGASPYPILWYRFSTGPNGALVASAIDSDQFGFTGIVTGNLTYSNNFTAGGKPFSLNATSDVDYITLPQNKQNARYLDQNQNFTLSVDAMPTGGTDNDQYGDLIAGKIISNGDGNCLTTYAIFYASSTQKFVGGVCGADGSTQYIFSADTFPLGSWHKVAVIYTTTAHGRLTRINLTVDGKSQGKLKIKDFVGPGFGSGGFQVGAGNFGNSDTGPHRRNFIGYIDEVMLGGIVPPPQSAP